MSGPSVLDASAVLAWLQDEEGADVVDRLLTGGQTTISTANWSEIAQKVIAAGGSWLVASALLDSYDVDVAPVSREDGEHAAMLWRRGDGLSLGDRLCLALGSRLGVDVITADRAWADHPSVFVIR